MKFNRILIIISLLVIFIASVGVVSASDVGADIGGASVSVGDVGADIEGASVGVGVVGADIGGASVSVGDVGADIGGASVSVGDVGADIECASEDIEVVNNNDIDDINKVDLDSKDNINNITEKQDPNFTFSYLSSITYGNDWKLMISGDVDLSGNVMILLDNENIVNLTFYDGKTGYLIPVDAGNHSIEFIYYNDTKYNDYSKVFNVTVVKANPEMSISVLNDDNSSLITYGDNGKVIIKFSNPISPYISETGFVSIRLDDGEWRKLVISSQELSCTFEDLTVGNHILYINYSGDNNHTNGSLSKSFEVLKKSLNNESITIDEIVYEEYDLFVHFPNDATGNITVVYNGKEYNGTVAYGEAIISMYPDLVSGNRQNINIKYSGDDNYNPADLDLLMNVESAKLNTTLYVSDLTLSVFDCEYLIITLKNSEGEAVSGNINISTATGNYTIIANNNGQAKFFINPTVVEDYIINIIYEGNRFNYGTNASVKITVNKIATAISASNLSIYRFNSKNLVLTLKDAKGNILVGKKVVITFNGKNYARTTNSKGQASLSIKSTVVKTYTVSCKFAEDNIYKSSSKSVKVTIKKAYVTVKDIIKAAKYLKSYSAKYKKLPKSRVVGSINCTHPQLVYLMTVAIKKINAKKKLTTKVQVINVKTAGTYNKKVSKKLTKKSYLSLVNTLYKKGVKGKVPKYIKKGKKIGYNVYAYSLAKILVSYNSKKRLPKYAIFKNY